MFRMYLSQKLFIVYLKWTLTRAPCISPAERISGDKRKCLRDQEGFPSGRAVQHPVAGGAGRGAWSSCVLSRAAAAQLQLMGLADVALRGSNILMFQNRIEMCILNVE